MCEKLIQDYHEYLQGMQYQRTSPVRSKKIIDECVDAVVDEYKKHFSLDKVQNRFGDRWVDMLKKYCLIFNSDALEGHVEVMLLNDSTVANMRIIFANGDLEVQVLQALTHLFVGPSEPF